MLWDVRYNEEDFMLPQELQVRAVDEKRRSLLRVSQCGAFRSAAFCRWRWHRPINQPEPIERRNDICTPV